MRLGFARSNFPKSIFPTMLGRPVVRVEETLIDGVSSYVLERPPITIIDDIELKVLACL
jgi:hypothetical protein